MEEHGWIKERKMIRLLGIAQWGKFENHLEVLLSIES